MDVQVEIKKFGILHNKQEMETMDNETIELELLLQAIYLKYGYDFRDYAKASIKRRVLRRLSLSKANSISEMQHMLLYDQTFFDSLLLDLSINVSAMFRDPSFYKAIRDKVVTVLKTSPLIKIWHAGCSTGEEAYSMAILLKEEGLYESTQIYATDFNQVVIEKAKEGIYSIDRMKENTINYHKAGGKTSFSDYFKAKYESAIIDKSLKEKILFADHNLVTDSDFGEMDMIVCRNVFIYFNKDLQNRIVKLFRDSLRKGGFLCLGSKESIRFSKYRDDFESVVANEKIYRKTS